MDRWLRSQPFPLGDTPVWVRTGHTHLPVMSFSDIRFPPTCRRGAFLKVGAHKSLHSGTIGQLGLVRSGAPGLHDRDLFP